MKEQRRLLEMGFQACECCQQETIRLNHYYYMITCTLNLSSPSTQHQEIEFELTLLLHVQISIQDLFFLHLLVARFSLSDKIAISSL